MSNQIATARVSSQLSGIQGRAIVSARGHHVVVDSPLALGGPNEELNPLDLILSALASCATFICETVAFEHGIPLGSVVILTEGDFDPRGLCGDPVDPRIQTLRVEMELSGPDDVQAQQLVEAFQARCPIYTTLSRAAPIEINVKLVEGKKMMKHVRCRDLGFDCTHEVQAETEAELLQQVAEHAVEVHNLEVTSEVVEMVKTKITEQ